MITIKDIINQILNITESYEMPEKLLSVMLDDSRRENFLNQLLPHVDTSCDSFRDYFQEEHGDRNKFKQDFTPDCVCRLLEKIAPDTDTVLDVCAGTGALTLNFIKGDRHFICEELTSRAIPILICNLALRNVSGIVYQKNVLTREIVHAYRLTSSERFSAVSECKIPETESFNCIISNPPYSLPWEVVEDERFNGYVMPPKSKADYAFILDILYRLSDSGKAFIILPHGILFRGAAEGKIRQKLIEENFIEAIIGLPDNMFLNTGIPVLVLVLCKCKSDKNVLFIDASKQFIKQGKINLMTDEHIKKIAYTYHSRQSLKKFSELATFEQIAENDFNLNIPRYVDTFEPEPPIDLEAVTADLIEIDKEIKKAQKVMAQMMSEIFGTNPESEKEYRKGINPLINFFKENSE